MSILPTRQPEKGCPRPVPSREEIAKNLVMQFAEGNMSLQMGWYITEQEIEALRQEVLDHDFLNP
jgi:hypothetical protein